MNDSELQKIFQDGQSVRLSSEAKRRGRAAVERFIELHPYRGVPVQPAATFLRIDWTRFFHRPAWALALLMFIVFSGGGVALAAERALPGDALYVVKTGLTEPLLENFTLSKEAEVDWQAELVERRIHETETLKQQGALQESKRQELETRLNRHVRKVEVLSETQSSTQTIEVRERVRERIKKSHSLEYREEERRIRVRVKTQEEDDADAKEEGNAERSNDDGEQDDRGGEEHSQFRSEEKEVVAPAPKQSPTIAPKSGSVKSLTPAKTPTSSTGTSSSSKTESSGSGSSSSSSSGSGSGASDHDDDDDENGSDEDDEEENGSQATISESAARTIALGAVSGTVTDSDEGTKSGIPVWEIKIRRASDNQEVKVIVSATNGSIVEIDD